MNRREIDKIKVLIVDDEPLAREGILTRLAAEPDIEIVAECGNGAQAVSALQNDEIDLVFLDVQMPKPDGFGVIKIVGVELMPYVIFVTAFDEYAMRAFEVHAVAYLLKPVDSAHFQAALDRARSLLRDQNADDLSRRLRGILDDLKARDRYLTRLSIRNDGRIRFVNVDEIDWIEAADNYVRIHTSGESHLLHSTMSGLEAKLDPREFLRIHRSAIVNVRRIRELHALFHGEYRIVLKNGSELTSGRSYRNRLQHLVDNRF